jgi:transcription-repair coupling factor (superfamily II helicase)
MQQSGHIFNIGFELYCQLLKRAVARIKGSSPGLRTSVAFRADFLVTSAALWRPAMIEDARLPAFLPEDYLPDSKLRIAAYKDVAELSTLKELKALRQAWRDRFGPLPEPAENLLQVAELKLAAAAAAIEGIEIKQQRLMLSRRGEFILLNGKFPRLTAPSPTAWLREAADWVKSL